MMTNHEDENSSDVSEEEIIIGHKSQSAPVNYLPQMQENYLRRKQEEEAMNKMKIIEEDKSYNQSSIGSKTNSHASEKETVKSGSRKHSVISNDELLDDFAREKTQYEYPTYPHRSMVEHMRHTTVTTFYYRHKLLELLFIYIILSIFIGYANTSRRWVWRRGFCWLDPVIVPI